MGSFDWARSERELPKTNANRLAYQTKGMDGNGDLLRLTLGADGRLHVEDLWGTKTDKFDSWSGAFDFYTLIRGEAGAPLQILEFRAVVVRGAVADLVLLKDPGIEISDLDIATSEATDPWKNPA